MLANNFYSIVNKRLIDGGFEVDVKFNEDHFIYKAHFPQNPITPGVCILQIGKELLSDQYKMPLMMVMAKNVKYLRVISPLSDNPVCFKIISNIDTDGLLKANISVEKDSTSYVKISSTYKQL
jgi:3-hydroxyacyl-[acyl-carrier-protein] dehydratase